MMADLTIAANITRTELSLSALQLNSGDYRIAGHNLDIGRVERRREVVKSPYVEGDVEVASIRDSTRLIVILEASGTTLTNLKTNVDTLITAFSQSEYTLTFTIDGAAFAYACRAADYEAGLVTERLAARQMVVGFECPRAPGTGVGG